MKSVPVLSLVALVVALGSAASARADSITVTLDNVAPARTFNYTLNGNDGSAYAGALHWTRVSGSTVLPQHFVTFCTEILQHVTFGQTVTYYFANVQDVPYSGPNPPVPGSGMGATKASLIRELWGTYHNQITNADTEAAFQIAIWEIVYDTDLNLSTGTFKSHYSGAPPSFVGTAQGWLNSLGKGDPTHSFDNDLFALSNGLYQDQLPMVPVPPSVLLFGMGSLGFVATVWRRRRAGQIAPNCVGC